MAKSEIKLEVNRLKCTMQMQNYSLRTLKSLGDPWLGNNMPKTGLGLIVDCKLNMSHQHIVAAKNFHPWVYQSIIRNIILNCRKKSLHFILLWSDSSNLSTFYPVTKWIQARKASEKDTGMIRSLAFVQSFLYHFLPSGCFISFVNNFVSNFATCPNIQEWSKFIDKSINQNDFMLVGNMWSQQRKTSVVHCCLNVLCGPLQFNHYVN